MTSTDDDTVLRVGGEPKRDTSGDHRAFVIVDAEDEPLTDVLHARRPKMAILMNLGRAIADAEALEAAGQDDQAGVAMMRVYDDFIDSVLTPESRDVIREQLADPDDVLDLDHLAAPMKALVGLWYARPTGGRRGSSGSPKRTGKRSTVRSRSAG